MEGSAVPDAPEGSRKRDRVEDPPDAVAAALSVMRHACCKHSNFQVGAALETTSGRLYTGCNVESDSYGLSMCAERVALFKALSEGERHFCKLVCATEDGSISCGGCRQLLREYCPPQTPALFIDANANVVRDTTVGAMLPDAFVLRPIAP